MTTGGPNVLPPLPEMFTTAALSQNWTQPASETESVFRNTALCLRSNPATGSDERAKGGPGPSVDPEDTATVSPGASPRNGQVLPPSNDVAQPGSTEAPFWKRPCWKTPMRLPD